MIREKLTFGRINQFTCPEGKQQDYIWDTEVPRLGVRTTRGGAKSFIFEGKLNRSTIRVTIGDVRAWDIDSKDPLRPGARQEARRLQTLVDQGIDPRLDRAEKLKLNEAKHIALRRLDVTVAEAWKAYVEARKGQWSDRHLEDHQNLARVGGKKAKRGNRKTVPGPLAALMPKRLADVTPETIQEWLKQETANRPTQARLAFGAFRAFLNWCEDAPAYKGLASPDSCTRKVARQSLPKKQAKKDALLREQLRSWFAAVLNISNPRISAYLQILLITGARREELACLRWEDVDLKWRSLFLHDKVDGDRSIPLTPYVNALLADLKQKSLKPPNVRKLKGEKAKEEWKPSPWVFSSKTAGSGRIQEPRFQHNKALAIAGIEGLTLHGLRRSFKSLSEWVETPAGIVAQIMGHKPSATAEKHYTVRPIDLLKMWHTRIETWILEQAGVPIPRQAAAPTPELIQGAAHA